MSDNGHYGARFFALAGLAGELARRAGLVLWQEGDSLKAAYQMFGVWREARETSALGAEHHNILSTIQDFIDRHGNGRFAPLAPGSDAPIVRDRARYWTDGHAPDDSRLYLFASGGLKEATKGFDFQRVLRSLDQAGAFFKKAPNRNPFPPGHRRVSVLCIGLIAQNFNDFTRIATTLF